MFEPFIANLHGYSELSLRSLCLIAYQRVMVDQSMGTDGVLLLIENLLILKCFSENALWRCHSEGQSP